jgi:hypothetical protein
MSRMIQEEYMDSDAVRAVTLYVDLHLTVQFYSAQPDVFAFLEL